VSAARQVLVIEGAGDAVHRLYLPSLRRLKSAGLLEEVALYFTDDSSLWTSDETRAARAKTIDEIASLGAKFLDKSEADQASEYQSIDASNVLIVTNDRTHVDLALGWLDRPNTRGARKVFIEKPLSDSIKGSRRLLGRLGASNHKVYVFDHYLQRTVFSERQMSALMDFLDNEIAEFDFYFLEDHSGAHAEYINEHERAVHDGAIENENRVDALRSGVILDLAPHVLAVASLFGSIATVKLLRLWCGQYTGVDGVSDQRSSIDAETLAIAEFVFTSWTTHGPKRFGAPINARIFLGKGVRGVASLGRERNVKMLELRSPSQNLVRIDFGVSGVTACTMCTGSREEFGFRVQGPPHDDFLRSLIAGEFSQRDGYESLQAPFLDVGTAKRMLEVIDDFRDPVPDKENIPTYPGGMQPRSGFRGRESLDLNDIDLPLAYGQ
jgi:hypothetical protein